MLPLVYIIATDLKQGDLHVLAGKFPTKANIKTWHGPMLLRFSAFRDEVL